MDTRRLERGVSERPLNVASVVLRTMLRRLRSVMRCHVLRSHCSKFINRHGSHVV